MDRPPAPTDRRHFDGWLAALGPCDPARAWPAFRAAPGPPTASAFTASAVFSSNIEGNPVNLNSLYRSRARGLPDEPRRREIAEIDALEAAYVRASSRALTEPNLLAAHRAFATFLPEGLRGCYRTGPMFVRSRHGIVYAAVEAERVPGEMAAFFEAVRTLRRTRLAPREAFYHAALLHLVFAHIHPFEDGNGRAARLIEKWFLAHHLGRIAWRVPSEAYYRAHLADYYGHLAALGPNFYFLEYARAAPFLTMLPCALRYEGP